VLIPPPSLSGPSPDSGKVGHVVAVEVVVETRLKVKILTRITQVLRDAGNDHPGRAVRVVGRAPLPGLRAVGDKLGRA